MKNKRSRFRVLLALILTVTILTLPLDTFALTGDRSDSPSAAANTATPDEAANEIADTGAGTLSGDGSQDNPYIIASASDWDALADSVLDGTSYEGRIILLEEDITVTRSLGHTDDISSASSPSYEFDGTFDGGGHTLTFTPPADSNANYVAPFSIVKNATIRNLKVEGEITAFNNLSGLIGAPKGTLLVENVLVDVEVEGNFVGGFVGHGVMADMTFRSCAFTGNLNGDTLAGGFVCWRGPVAWEASGNPALHIENCLFAGTASGAADFHPIGFTQQTNVSAEISDMWATADGQNNGKGFYNYQYQGTSYRSTAATVVNGISSSRPWMGYFDVIDCPPVEGSFTDALYAWTIGSTLALLTDVTTDSTITVPSGEHTLDLNGCGIKMTGNGAVINVGSGVVLDLYDSDTDATHKFDVPDGAGLAVLNEASGNYTVNGGYITGGTGSLTSKNVKDGGGVWINSGVFRMHGGTIIGNKSGHDGGGVCLLQYAQASSAGIFEMSGGAIIYNETEDGWGGGISVGADGYGTIRVSGGEISHNRSNRAQGRHNGGGIDLQNGTLELSGDPQIKDNFPSNVAMVGAPSRMKFNVKVIDVLDISADIGVAIIDKSNNKNTPTTGVFIKDWNTGIMSGKNPADYFTSDDNNYQVFLNGNGEAEIGVPPVASVINGDTTTNYGSLSDAVNAWTAGSTLKLMTDVTTSSTITVASGAHTLDLNGHGFKMTGSGAVIKVGSGSTLNMNDSDTGATHKFDVPDGAGLAVLNEASGTYTVNGGYITGGNEQLAGGVYIDQNGTFNMYGGCIIGNKATVHGGGVDVSAPGTKTAIFNVYGGSICYNSAPWGGGINVFGTAYVNEGCTIHHNTASNGGGGIELENGGKLYLNGSTVTENVVLAQNGGMWKGGGVHIPNGTECHLQGAVKIKDNYRETFGTAQSNVFVRQEVPGKVILDSSLTSNTPIGVGTNGAKPFTVTSAYGTYHGTTDPSKYFTSDYDDCWITLNNNGEADVAKKPVAMITSGDDTSYYSDLSSALSAWTAGSTLKLLSDAATSSTITVPTGEHTLDLSGYELKRTGATGSDNSGLAVTVKDGVTLTVIGPGKITGGKGFHGGGIHVEGNSSLVLDNCEISGNTGHYGGGLYLSKGTITLKNGTVVKGNSASEGFGGSGIYAEGGGTLILEDSKFINNEIKNNNQYAVFLAGNANVKVSGAPVINDNTYGGMQKDLYLYQAGDQHSNVQVIGELTDGAKIIVGQTTGTGVIGSDWKAYMGDVDPADYLVSADTDYVVFANKDDELEIGYPEITGVSAEGFEGDYDGEAHKISVTTPDGATIKYGTTEGSCTLTENPTYTDAGTYTVYYEVSKNKYRSTYGSATVTIYQINATVTITGRSLTVDYDGKAHSADGYDAVASSNLYDVNKDFTFSGRAEAVRTNVGTTKMNLSADKFTNTNTNFANVTFIVTDGFLTVNPVDAVITTAPHAKSELIYNGSDQELIAAGAADGGTLYYALGDDAKTAPADESYETAIPTAAQIGNYYIWYMVKGDSNHNDLSASCMKITMADQGWGTVSGAVVDENHSPVKNATVSLIMGGRVIDEIASGSDGSYYFTVPAGIYNIVVKSSDATVTEMVNVSDRTTYDLTVPDSDTDSVLDIVDTDGNIVVGGLSKEAAAVRNTEGVSADQNVTVRMTVKTVSESDTTGSQAISGIAGDMFVEYYDFMVEKTVDTVTSSMDRTQTVLELVIPCSYTNKRELTVYNSDGSGAQTLTLSDSREAGTFRVDQNAGLVYIYTDRIATYAVGYKPYYSIKSEVSLGSFSGNVSVKLTKDTTGETYALNNVSLNSISFAGLPKGTYSMTITWTDGAENTLTTPFIIK